MFGQKRLAIILAEFLGTALLTLAIYTVISKTTFPIFSGLAAGLTVTLLVMVFGNVSGGHFNPAVTLAHWTRSHISTLHAIVNIAAQFLGAFVALGLISYFMKNEVFNMAGDKFAWPVFVAEAIGAAVFTFGIGAAVYMEVEGSKFAAAIGLSLFLGILVASLGSNAIINPAVALGVQSWDWAYATGPLVGGIIGMNLYYIFFAADWQRLTRTRSRSTSKKKSRR